MDLIHQIEHNPDYGAKITLGHLFIAFFIRVFEGDHVNPIIMDVAQLGAWLIGIVVGCLTAVSYIKKLFEDKKHKR